MHKVDYSSLALRENYAQGELITIEERTWRRNPREKKAEKISNFCDRLSAERGRRKSMIRKGKGVRGEASNILEKQV